MTTQNDIVRFRFKIERSDKERIAELKFGMNDTEVFVRLGDGINSRNIHPDLLCLCSILLVNPFVGERLLIGWDISDDFQKKAQSVISRYKLVTERASNQTPRDPIQDGLAGLAFSGGADSSAALAVMPASTVPIFLSRISENQTVYDSDAPIEICRMLTEVGYPVKIIESNLEHIREPVGFPTDLANAIPSILLTEFCNLSSISFGTIMESGYGIGHEHYVEYGEGAHWRFFSTIFSAAEIRLSFPVIGVSEIGTSIIGNKSPLGYYSQSCIRGTWKNPCLKCWKCFRKELLAFALGFSQDVNLLEMLNSNEVQIRLSAYPISHENVIAYSLQKINLDNHPYLKPIADKIDMNEDLSFLDYWYSPSIDFVPEEIRHNIRDAIINYLQLMGPLNESVMRSWDMTGHLESKKAKRAQSKLTSFWQDLPTKSDL